MKILILTLLLSQNTPFSEADQDAEFPPIGQVSQFIKPNGDIDTDAIKQSDEKRAKEEKELQAAPKYEYLNSKGEIDEEKIKVPPFDENAISKQQHRDEYYRRKREYVKWRKEEEARLLSLARKEREEFQARKAAASKQKVSPDVVDAMQQEAQIRRRALAEYQRNQFNQEKARLDAHYNANSKQPSSGTSIKVPPPKLTQDRETLYKNPKGGFDVYINGQYRGNNSTPTIGPWNRRR